MDIFSFGIPPRYLRARLAASVIAIVIVISILSGGTAYASQGSLPGNLLYPVKIVTENTRLLLSGDSASKARLNIQYASNRLAELSKVVNRNEYSTTRAITGYRRNIEAVINQLQLVSTSPLNRGLFESILNEIQNQVAVCDNLIDSSPLYVESVREADALVINGQVDTLEILAQYDALRATEINVNAMQNRLQRALTSAGFGNYLNMEQVLYQYQQLNQLCQQILQSAQTTGNYNTQIQNLILQTQAGNLLTLQNISRQTPAEYQNTIKICTQLTNQLQERARIGQQSHGNGLGDGREPFENNNNSTSTQEGQNSTTPQGGADNTGDETPGPNSGTTSPGDGGGNGESSGPSNDGGGSGSGGQGSPTPGLGDLKGSS
jgi:uncharacterized membrane protein YgcG